MKKIISTCLIFLLIFSSLVYQSFGEELYSFELDLSTIDSFSERIEKGDGGATIKSDADGSYLSIASTSNSQSELFADVQLPKSLEASDNTYYVFNVDVRAYNGGNACIFNLNKMSANKTWGNALGYVRYQGGKFQLLDPDLRLVKEIEEAKGEKHSITVVYKGKSFDSIYLDGEKYQSNYFPALPSSLTEIGFFKVSWAVEEVRFSNISVKQISTLAMSSKQNIEDCTVYPGGLDLEFNNKLQAIGEAVFTDAAGETISAATKISGTTLSLTPKRALVPNQKYILSLTEVKDIFGYSFSKSDITVNTVSKAPIYIDEDFAGSDGLLKFTLSGGSMEHENKALKLSVPAASSARLSYSGTILSHEITAGRYVRELSYTANTIDGKIEFFKFGDLAGEYLLEASEKSGEEGLWLKAANGTDFNTKISAGASFSIAAVYDKSLEAYDIYYNNKKINTAAIPLLAESFKNASSILRTAGAETAYDSIDDIRYYKISEFSAIELIDSAVNTGDTVKCYLDKMTFDFTQDITPSTISAVSLKDKNGAEVDIDVAIENSKSLIITLNERLSANTDYTLDISSISGKAPLYKDGKISFKTEDSLNVSLPILSGTAIGTGGNLQQGDLNVSVNVNNKTYSGSMDSASLIVVVYKNYKILEIKSKSVAYLTDIDTELNVSVGISDTEDVYVKVFVVDSLKSRCPLTATYKVE